MRTGDITDATHAVFLALAKFINLHTDINNNNLPAFVVVVVIVAAVAFVVAAARVCL